MNPFLARELLTLNDCGCCEGTDLQTPARVVNRSGLSALAYRTGAYEQFKQSLLAQLSGVDVPALQELTTRDDDDFAIALLDAWSTMADVLTFYQERIVQESYLRTATERLSIRHLARLIGYQLSPGVAASTPLAFTVDDLPGSPAQVRLDAGTKVQSIPGQDEQAQIFETIAPITARATWNALRPRQHQSHSNDSIEKSVTVQGIANNIRRGDKLLIVKSRSERSIKTVFRVEIDQTTQTTRLDLDSGEPPVPPRYSEPDVKPNTSSTEQDKPLTVRSEILEKTRTESDVLAFSESQGWLLDDLTEDVTQRLSELSQPAEVFVFRLSASPFGYSAAKQVTYEELTDEELTESSQWVPKSVEDWLEVTLEKEEADDRYKIFLDNAYAAITKGSYVAILAPNPNSLRAYKVNASKIHSRTAYGISSKTTQLKLDGAWWEPRDTKQPYEFRHIRESMVYAASEKISLAPLPILEPVTGSQITLDGFYLGLQPGQIAILTGEVDTLKGVTRSEVISISQITFQKGYTQLTLQKDLTHTYHRDTVTINANVAPATHGETVQEVLGSGNASQPHQTFTLRQPPLTYISSATAASGALSTLQIRVNDLLWQSVSSLYRRNPSDRIYQTKQNEDGTTTLKFSDGRTGSRLPTGQENIQATYRKGIGLAGNLKENQLTLLMSRPLGLKDVTNPLPASGGDDPETLDTARKNAPLTVLTLDRVVSLQDYEDFANAFAGIAKALATWTWLGQQRGVFLTVAGPEGNAVSPDLISNLTTQIKAKGDPHIPVRIKTYNKAVFLIEGGIYVQPDYSDKVVLSAVKQALLHAFSFEQREFGQAVALSEVVEVIHSIPGVTAVDIDNLTSYSPGVLHVGASEFQQDGTQSPLPAAMPKVIGNNLFAAELWTVEPSSLEKLGVIS